MNADGSGTTRLTNSPAEDASPSWSPDGARIAFDTNRDGNYEIYVMNANGTGQFNLSSHPGSDGYPTWSPDGATVAFQSDRNGNHDIYAVGSEGAGLTNLTNSIDDEFIPSWSPDGSRLAFNRGDPDTANVFIMSAGGGPVTKVTSNSSGDFAPAWSPDGVRIVFHSERGGNRDVYAVNYDGTGETRLTSNAAPDVSADWQALPPVMCTIESVVDGDTFTCMDGKLVNMLQITTPDLGQCGGAWAKAALENIFLTPGRVVRLDFDRTQTAGATTFAAPVVKGSDGVDYNISIIMAYVGLAKSTTIGANNMRYLDWANASQAWAQAAQWNMWAPGKTYTGGCD